jgi:transposase
MVILILFIILKILIQMIKEKPDMYLDEIAVNMALRTGKTVSSTTIWQSLKYCGITHKKVCLLFILK